MPSPTFEAAWAQKQTQFQALLSDMSALAQAEFGSEVPASLLGEGTLEVLAQVDAVDSDGNDMTSPQPFRLVRAVMSESRHNGDGQDEDGNATLSPGPVIVGLIGIQA